MRNVRSDCDGVKWCECEALSHEQHIQYLEWQPEGSLIGITKSWIVKSDLGGAWKLRIEGAECVVRFDTTPLLARIIWSIQYQRQYKFKKRKNARSCSVELSEPHKCFLYHLNLKISTAGLLVEKQRQGEKWTLVRAAFRMIAHKQSPLSWSTNTLCKD